MNARWSVNTRVPKLGDDTTKIEDVDRFYNFWFSFKSWREFTYNQEYDPDQAECREERRWMERQNNKQAKSLKRAEGARIRTLTETAYKLDPRIRRRKDAERMAKENAKEEKRRKKMEIELAKKAEEDRVQREAAEAEAREKEQMAIAKKEKEQLRKLVRKARQRIRSATADVVITSIHVGVHVEMLCAGLDLAGLEAFADVLETCDSSTLEETVRIEHAHMEENRKRDAAGEERQPRPAAPSPPLTTAPQASAERGIATGLAESSWTAQEKSLLSKALAKFPGGTRERWNKVAEFVQTRSADECLA